MYGNHDNQTHAMGAGTLDCTTDGLTIDCTGSGALEINTSGVANTAVGFDALDYPHCGYNTSVGQNSLASCTGSNNTAIGHDSLSLLEDGSNNTALGSKAQCMGNNSIAIGYNAHANGNNSIAIGVNAAALDNEIWIGNPKNSDKTKVYINGNLYIRADNQIINLLDVIKQMMPIVRHKQEKAAITIQRFIRKYIFEPPYGKLYLRAKTSWNDNLKK